MREDQRRRLEGVLDALDRLFDGVSDVAEIQELVAAVAVDLDDVDEWSAVLERAATDLRVVMTSGQDRHGRQAAGLTATDDLRIMIADLPPL